jgi:LytS/YehU family sensor histidine kinase
MIIGLFALVSPVVDPSFYADTPRVIVVPLALLFTQILVYVAVLHIFEQQQKSFETQLILKEFELNVLRAQSNPHFLFNTLNLITSEIIDNPENALEIVYDLSDLLRSNIALSNQAFTTVSEEFHLVELFLTLQQKRFKERLDYEMDIGEGTQNLKIPALLLQPAIENAIKHAVAPYPESAKIQVRSFKSGARLVVEITDSGPNFDDQKVIEHEGFRILRKTLSLHYPSENDLTLTSTEHGGLLHLSFPAHAYSLEQKSAK